MSWGELQALHLQENHMQGSREPAVEEEYRKFREGPRHETDEIRAQLQTTPFLLKLNLFPYKLPPDPTGRPLAHVLMWCTERDCDFAEADQRWKKLIKEQNCVVEGIKVDPGSYVLTRNIQANQTVPDITHYHVFISIQ
jgi:hypothetical protein